MRLRCVLPVSLCLAGVTLSVGCLIFPTFHTQGQDWNDQHKPIDAAKLRTLKVGELTKARVLEELGTPSHMIADGTILVFSWSSQRDTSLGFRIWVCGEKKLGGGDDALRSPANIHHLVLRFDPAGLLCESRVRTGGYVDSAATGMDSVVKFATN